MRGRWRCDDGGDFIYNSVLLKRLSLSVFVCECVCVCACVCVSVRASFSVLWKVLLSVVPRFTPTETVNYQRWQRSFHLATITHIPQPPSKDLQSPTQVQGRCSVGTSWRVGRWVCLIGLLHWHTTVRTYCIRSMFWLLPTNCSHYH